MATEILPQFFFCLFRVAAVFLYPLQQNATFNFAVFHSFFCGVNKMLYIKTKLLSLLTAICVCSGTHTYISMLKASDSAQHRQKQRDSIYLNYALLNRDVCVLFNFWALKVTIYLHKHVSLSHSLCLSLAARRQSRSILFYAYVCEQRVLCTHQMDQIKLCVLFADE